MDGWIRIGTELETKSVDSQISELERQLNVMSNTLESDSKVQVSVKMSKEERTKLESDIEKIKNKIISLRQEKSKLENGGINLEGTKVGFEGLMKSAKRLVGGIIGIRAAYGLVRKASSAWISNDQRLTNQMEANWVGLGAVLSEVIETVVKGIKKLITGILYFMQILTGTNYIAKANAAILKKQTKETNNLAKANDKLTTSFDELNILQDNSSGGVSADSGIDTSALFDVNDLSESARTAIEKVAKALQPVYTMLKNIIKWAADNPEVVLGILGGIALLGTLAKILGVAGTGTAIGSGLAGILGVLLAIVSIGIITVEIVTIYKSVKEAQKATKTANEAVDSFEKNIKKFSNTIKEQTKAHEINNEQVKVASDYFKIATENSLIAADSYKKQKDELGLLEYAVYKATGEYDGMRKTQLSNINTSYDNLKAWGELYKQGLLNDEQTQDYMESLELFIGTLDNVGTSTFNLTTELGINEQEAEKLQKKYQNAKDQLKEMGGQSDKAKEKIANLSGSIAGMKTNVTVKVDAETNGAKNAINNLFSGLSSKLGAAFGIVMPTIRLAKGGIINNPGRGVPIGRAIGGEAGIEGVIPLTDSQQMALLGQEIGKWITLNMNITNEMDGRVLNKRLETIKQNNNFSTNGGM